MLLSSLLTKLGGAFSLVALLGSLQTFVGGGLLFFRRRRDRALKAPPAPLPPVTVMKPLCGAEPLLQEALESVCQQDYPGAVQIIFGVQDAADPAISVVRALQEKYPHLDMELVINPAIHGANLKVSNLVNMMARVRHELLVLSDSDIHVTPDYLSRVVAALMHERVGLVTTLYAGLPAVPSVPALMGAAQINHNFLPGVLLSRLMKRQDCLGATMALRRTTLRQIGGLEILLPYVADDAFLGYLVRKRGLDIALAPCMTWTTVAETSLRAVYEHEIRWGRTVKSVEPAGYAASIIQLPLFWAFLALVLNPTHPTIWGIGAVVWALRACGTQFIDHLLRVRRLRSVALLPLRDITAAIIILISLTGRGVVWRGQKMQVTPYTSSPGGGKTP